MHIALTGKAAGVVVAIHLPTERHHALRPVSNGGVFAYQGSSK